MIVRLHDDHLLLITQPEHAALSGRLIERWRTGGFPGRPSRADVLFATSEHDNGWIEPDASPTVDPRTGRPYDFIHMPDPVKHAIWPRAVARHAADRPYVAALIAEHALTVHGSHRDEPGWRDFFSEISDKRDDCLARAGNGGRPADLKAFRQDYGFVFLGDLMSLVFCNGWTEPFEAEGYRIILLGNRLQVTPDPFGGGTVPLRARARRIPNRRYGSDAALRDALANAEEHLLSGGTAAGAPQPPTP